MATSILLSIHIYDRSMALDNIVVLKKIAVFLKNNYYVQNWCEVTLSFGIASYNCGDYAKKFVYLLVQ